MFALNGTRLKLVTGPQRGIKLGRRSCSAILQPRVVAEERLPVARSP